MLSLQDADGHDLICPVNNPIRTCESDQLGAGYGDTAKQALGHGRELRFLLSTADYDRFEPYVERALARSTEAESIRASDEYFDQSDNLRTGLLRVTIIRADVSEYDEVRSADLNLNFLLRRLFRLPLHSVVRDPLVLDGHCRSMAVLCYASLQLIRVRIATYGMLRTG